MIEIRDLEGKVKSDVIDFLVEKRSTSFEIYIPKTTQKYFSENEAIAFDYAQLAYSGQLLKEVSDEFAYEKVPPELNESVLFKIETKKLDELAVVLLKISFGYVNDCDDEMYEDTEVACEFSEEVGQFLYEIEMKQIIPICEYFHQIYLEYILENEIE